MLMRPDAIVVDGSYLLHRTYHSLPPKMSKCNNQVNAVVGITKVVLGMYNYFEPSAMIVVFDSPEPTFRHLLSKEYKAHRPEYPEDLLPQIELVIPLLEAFGFTVVRSPGNEGDDIVGTLATICAEELKTVYVATADKDMLQLINDRIKVYDPFKQYVFSYDEVYIKLGVNPDQVADYLAIVGDKADGIKGIHGAGPHMAKHVLRSYGNIDGIRNALSEGVGPLDGLTARLTETLRVGMENIELDRKLTGIVIDLDLGVELKDLYVKVSDDPGVAKLCDQYNIYQI